MYLLNRDEYTAIMYVIHLYIVAEAVHGRRENFLKLKQYNITRNPYARDSTEFPRNVRICSGIRIYLRLKK